MTITIAPGQNTVALTDVGGYGGGAGSFSYTLVTNFTYDPSNAAILNHVSETADDGSAANDGSRLGFVTNYETDYVIGSGSGSESVTITIPQSFYNSEPLGKTITFDVNLHAFANAPDMSTDEGQADIIIKVSFAAATQPPFAKPYVALDANESTTVKLSDLTETKPPAAGDTDGEPVVFVESATKLEPGYVVTSIPIVGGGFGRRNCPGRC